MHALREVPRPAEAGALDVEIVVPVYNEQDDLVRCVRRLHEYLRDFPFSSLITIADNASTDATLLLAYRLAAELPGVRVTALTKVTGRTGVEMEALTAVSVACLTVYDMMKAVDREIIIDQVKLLSKTGGTRGDWRRSGG